MLNGTTGDVRLLLDNGDESLVFDKTEIAFWQAEAADIFVKAKARAKELPVDPLFARVPDGETLYRQYLEATMIRYLHARLIERALVDFADRQDGWEAYHEADVMTRRTRRKPDCLALNRRTGQLFVFEVKRATRDAVKEKAIEIDARLREIVTAIKEGRHKIALPHKTINVFVLAFYGARIPSKFDVYDRNTVDAVFGSGIASATRQLEEHIEVHAMLQTADKSELDLRVEKGSNRILKPGDEHRHSVFDARLDDYAQDACFEIRAEGFDVVSRDRFWNKRREWGEKMEREALRREGWSREKQLYLRRTIDG